MFLDLGCSVGGDNWAFTAEVLCGPDKCFWTTWGVVVNPPLGTTAKSPSGSFAAS